MIGGASRYDGIDLVPSACGYTTWAIEFVSPSVWILCCAWDIVAFLFNLADGVVTCRFSAPEAIDSALVCVTQVSGMSRLVRRTVSV